MTVSTSSCQTASLVSIGTCRVFAISRESCSISSSLRCLKTLAARSGPRLTSSTAAFERPGRLSFGRGSWAGRPGEAAGAAGSMSEAIALVLLHPGADLLGDALGVVVGDALGAQERRGRAGHRAGDGGHAGRAAGLEVGERRRRLDLAQPRRLAERLALALLEVAHDEEEEAEEAEADGAVLRVAHDVAGRAGRGGGGRGLGERDLADVEDVAALRVDAGGGRHGVLDLGDLGGRDRLVDDEADTQA